MGERGVSPNLSSRLQDIPGVASVAVDLTDSGGGINVRLEPGADEAAVMEKLRTLLVAYGVRSAHPPKLRFGRQPRHVVGPLPVDIKITPLDGGKARVEVATKVIRSFRVVSANPMALAQGLAETWCQVIGKIPVEVTGVEVSGGMLRVVISGEDSETEGVAPIADGWEEALGRAVGRALGVVDPEIDTTPIAVNS